MSTAKVEITSPKLPPAVSAAAERKAMLQWTGIILFLLIGSVGMWIYAAILAVSDPTMAVVPDYHEKALRWDEHLAAQKESNDLGWTAHAIPGASKNGDGIRELTFFLRDNQSQPVAGAHGSVRLYHYARGKDPQTVDLKETDPGTYVATVQMARDGRWQFDLTLDRDKQHFEWNQAQELQLP